MTLCYDVFCVQDEDKQLLRNGHVLHEQERAAQRAARVARKASLGAQDTPLPPSLSLPVGEVSEQTVASSRAGSTRNRTASRRKRLAGWGKPAVRHQAPTGSTSSLQSDSSGDGMKMFLRVRALTSRWPAPPPDLCTLPTLPQFAGAGCCTDMRSVCVQRVGQHDLLTASEEKELSVKVQSLLKLEVVRDELQESLQREPTLAEWASGVSMDADVLGEDLTGMQAARDRMISSNLRLVVSIAKRYMSRCLPAGPMRVMVLCREAAA